MATDTLKASIAELIGKKPADMKLEPGSNLVRNMQAELADLGYKVKSHFGGDKISARHIVLYAGHDGTVHAVLSDSEAAGKVKPISRLTITKADKAEDSKEA